MYRVGHILVILSLVCVQDVYSDIFETPFMAAIFWLQGDGYRFHCNGAIVSNRHVLTTATCVGDKVGGYIRDIMVRVGSSNHLYGGQEHLVENVNKHFKFSPDLDSDIAILKLTQPLKLSNRVALVNLPERDLSQEEALFLSPKVNFYQNLRFSDSSLNNLIHSAFSNYRTNLECNNHLKSNFPYKDLVTENMLCFYINAYQGTNMFGAPWVHNGTIYGICSWDRKNVNIFTKVAAFTDWIKNWIR